jgi:hypothetical protein
LETSWLHGCNISRPASQPRSLSSVAALHRGSFPRRNTRERFRAGNLIVQSNAAGCIHLHAQVDATIMADAKHKRHLIVFVTVQERGRSRRRRRRIGEGVESRHRGEDGARSGVDAADLRARCSNRGSCRRSIQPQQPSCNSISDRISYPIKKEIIIQASRKF